MRQFSDEQLDYLWNRLAGELEDLKAALDRTSPADPADIDRRVELLRKIANVRRGLADLEGCDAPVYQEAY